MRRNKKIISAVLISVILVLTGILTSCLNTQDTHTQAMPTDTESVDTTAQGDTQQTNTPEGQTATATETDEKLSVFAMNGPTGISLVKLTQNEKYEFTFADSADEAMADLISGRFDIASIPTNLAAILNNKAAGTYKIVAVNTLGVLYLLDSTGEIKSVSDLRGKTVHATGEGLIPGFVLEYVLTKNGLEIGKDVNIEYYSSPADVGSLLLSGNAEIAMLPQPYVTTILTKAQGALTTALDMTEEFDKVSKSGTRLMTSCIVVNTKTVSSNKIDVEAFLSEVSESVEYVNTHTDEAASEVAKLGIIPSEEIAKKAIPLCNTVCLYGDDMKNAAVGFYNELYLFKPSLCGGKVPGDELFI